MRNRGLRDSVLWTIDRFKGEGPAPTRDDEPFSGSDGAPEEFLGVEFRAGAVRLLQYELKIDGVIGADVPAEVAKSFRGAVIRGEKRLTYSRRANPWRQLMEVSLKAFPRAGKTGSVLTLDTGYLARQGVPLFRVVQQQDKVKALVDIACLGLYLARMLIHIHVWSFRMPDDPACPAISSAFRGTFRVCPSPKSMSFRLRSRATACP